MQSADNPQNKLQGIMVNPQPIFRTLLSLINGHTPWESRHLLNYNGVMNVEHIQIQVCNFNISVLFRALLQALQVWLSHIVKKVVL